MRTFHIGGAASRSAAISNVQVKSAGTVRLSNLKSVVNREGNLVAVSRSGEVGVVDDYGRERERYKIPYGAVLSIQEGGKINAGDIIVTWDPHTHPVITEVDGVVGLIDFVDGVTVQKQSDEVTGLSSLVVTDPKQRGGAGKELRPMVKLLDENGNAIFLPGTEIPAQYFLPAGAIVGIKDGGEVKVGDVLARIPQESSKTRDITGGLPRVADLFEARKTKDPAILAETSGTISFGKETKGKQRVVITDAAGEQYETLIPKWRHITVFEGEYVEKGETIAEGELTPHVKRGGKIWIRIFPDKPITKKPLEVRMGKGKGSVEYWVAQIKPGTMLYEIQGVSEELAREAFALAAAKLPLKTTFTVRTIM